MEHLTIEKIEVTALNIALKEPITISLGTCHVAENLIIKIFTGNGMVGTGEASPEKTIVGETQPAGFEIAKLLATTLKGKDPLAIEERIHDMDRAVQGNPTVKSAFDMALYDLLARKAALPLYRLLGGGNSRTIYTDMTVYLGSPAKMAEQALTYKNEGFPTIKIKLGTTAEEDVERIRTIREAIGLEIPIRIDANQGWDTVTAIKTLKLLEPFNIDYCEEPIPHWNNADLRRVRDHSPIPVMADESVFDHRDALRLACMGATDYFNIKFSKSGGIHNAIRINAVAEAAGIKTQVGCMSESRYALTALCHFAAANKNVVYYDIDSSLSHAEDPVTGGIRYMGKGKWVLPETPGIGADFDPGFLDKMKKATI